MPTVQEMQNRTDTLTNTQRRIFDYMFTHPEAVCYATLKNISGLIGASEVSILKMCRNLGCSGYAEMKKAFQIYIKECLRSSYNRNYRLETMEETSYHDRHAPIPALFETEQRNLSLLAASVSDQEVAACAKLLMQSRAVLLFGHDVSKVLADYFAHRLNYLRIKASSFRLGDISTVQTSLSMAGKHDTVILFSFPPYYKPVSNVARYARDRGAAVIVITDSMDSPAITENAHCFICNTKTKVFFNTLTGPFSLINVLTSYIAMKMGPELHSILEEELTASHSMLMETEKGESDI